MWEVGIALALVAALMTNLASLLKHRGCRAVDPITIRRPLRSARRLAGSPWFAAGWSLAAIAWLIHVAALSMAPISLVQTMLAGGAVTLAVMSQRIFGEPVARRQWLALLLGGGGLALILLTVPELGGSHSEFSTTAILGFEGGLALLALGLLLGHSSDRLGAHRGVLLATLAGTLIALAGVAIKGLTGAEGASLAIVAPWIAVTVLCGAFAQYAVAAAFQGGEAVETIGLIGLVANVGQIGGGVLVFGDPLPGDPLGIALQVTAFAMVCAAGLLLPSGVRLPAAGRTA